VYTQGDPNLVRELTTLFRPARISRLRGKGVPPIYRPLAVDASYTDPLSVVLAYYRLTIDSHCADIPFACVRR